MPDQIRLRLEKGIGKDCSAGDTRSQVINGSACARIPSFFHGASLGRIYEWGMIDHIGIYREALLNGNMRPAKFTLGQCWKHIFQTDHPRQIWYFHYACFSVKREVIQRRSKEFYQKALSVVDDHSNPGEGHYIERLWYSFMTDEKNDLFRDRWHDGIGFYE